MLCRNVRKFGLIFRLLNRTKYNGCGGRGLHSGCLSSTEVEEYKRNGVLVLEDFVSNSECEALKGSASRILNEYFQNASVEKPSIFTTVQQERQSDEYFLGSGDKIRCFYEPDAFKSDGSLRTDIPPSETINKIGHCMHELDYDWWKLSDSNRVVNLCDSIGMRVPRIPQSMYIFKQPRIGGQVSAHQDSTFLYTNPLSTVGIWVAIEDAHEDNGCLWGVLGSHRNGIHNRFVRAPSGGTEFHPKEEHTFNVDDAVPLPVKKGTAILLDGSFVHFSHDNRSNASRHALTLHVIEGDVDVKYPDDNWLQREDGKPFMRPVGNGDTMDNILVTR